MWEGLPGKGASVTGDAWVSYVEEFAEIIRLKRSHAYEPVRKGVIPSVRLGGFIRVPRELLMRMGLPQESNTGGAKR